MEKKTFPKQEIKLRLLQEKIKQKLGEKQHSLFLI